jgi:hypothetical protein
LLRLEVWAALILTQGLLETGQSGLDAINRIATELTFDLSGLDGDFLKVAAGTVFQIAGTDDDHRVGPGCETRDTCGDAGAGLLRRFLSVHLFNVVWFQTGIPSEHWRTRIHLYTIWKPLRASAAALWIPRGGHEGFPGRSIEHQPANSSSNWPCV